MKTIILAFFSLFLSSPVALGQNQPATLARTTYQGFGATTTGGSRGTVVHVTNLNDSGPGSLRSALSHGKRHIVFDVGGEILLKRRLYVRGANVTIDGFTAPPPGITIKNYGLKIYGSKGAHDIIARGIRVRVVNDQPGKEDGIEIAAGTYNVVIDHVSVCCASDENIAIRDADTRDVTVSWSILAGPRDFHPANFWISRQSTRISIHHNILMKARRRNPWIKYAKGRTSAEIQADVRNNLIWDVSGSSTHHGTVVFNGAKANVVNNYYKGGLKGCDSDCQKRVILICKNNKSPEDAEFCNNKGGVPAGGAYLSGNVSQDGWTDYINTKGTETKPFLAPPVDTTDACTAAHQVLAGAGVRPLDLIDKH
ncbi:MAG: hypothetical protein ACE5JO_13470, partial [Candidatus Binatia bacterium]